MSACGEILMILHKVCDNPYHSNQLASCLTRMAADDGLLIMQEAVYVMPHHSLLEKLASLNSIYILEADCLARGIVPKLGKSIDYAEFVALTLSYKQIISW
jgi:tRNA 2-thiouridine synthesizing protein B